ncbi:septum site-determining protein MinC [Leptothoe kymatousa]|uniref:Probable septum site-determining protein MinC n=1 Tax=Leptothoe kymatousa TAU-MAC 1615 TaxID=2364775 RepID=A0ABS5Y684_9CYAN|nr:septum site-determining protein MinC [Leptothoe kymatousa]MBT9313369.1 septum site-determining protein MinC [Leptothoe kymatousa TAU-MAC 1615]
MGNGNDQPINSNSSDNPGDIERDRVEANTSASASPPRKSVKASPKNASKSSRAALSARLKRSKDVELFVFDETDQGDENTSPLVDVSTIDLDVDTADSQPKQQITLKSEQGRLLLLLPSSSTTSFAPSEWEELCQQLTLRLNSGDRFLQPNTTVHLIARDRLLDGRQLQEIDELLSAAQLHMKRVYTQRRQTAVAAVTAGYSVEQNTKLDHFNQSPDAGEALDAPLYLQATVRSGTEIRHPGSIVVLGDLNPGGSLVAAGDIFVWGRLRGVAHAGSEGNADCRIMALQMEPTQLRIADKVARAPEKPPAHYQPEVAYISQGSIRIAIAADFAQLPVDTP